MCKKQQEEIEVDRGEGLEWLLNAIKDSKERTWEVMTWNRMQFHQMMSNRKCFQHEESKVLMKEAVSFLRQRK